MSKKVHYIVKSKAGCFGANHSNLERVYFSNNKKDVISHLKNLQKFNKEKNVIYWNDFYFKGDE